MSLVVRAGTAPIVLVAPHGGRRDPRRRPWGSEPLRMNDLHTASLAHELAGVTGAAVLANDTLDRNEVDLNRLSAAHDHHPDFLLALERLIAEAHARHGRCTVITVHGWNVIQPALDVGLGCAGGRDPLVVDGAAAVSAGFAHHGVGTLLRACAARGIAATVGARYPARARENLIQLFTTRHRLDTRPLVQRLVALGQRTDAIQLELGVPLRWPGGWRQRLISAVREALPALAGETPSAPVAADALAAGERGRSHAPRHVLEFAGPGLAGLAAIDPGGGRLLLFPPDGSLLLFTGERVGRADRSDRVAGLSLARAPDGGLRLAFDGPLARFADTSPFVDLEHGLAGAAVLERVRAAIEFVPDHVGAGGMGEFGRVRGGVVLGDETWPVDAAAFAVEGPPPSAWPRLRVALRLDERVALSLTVATGDGSATGFLCDGRRHHPVETASAAFGPHDAPLAQLVLDVRVAGAAGVRVRAEPVHRLPVVRGGVSPAVRVLYAACRLEGRTEASGWCELGGY